jgi:hypothetical protein
VALGADCGRKQAAAEPVRVRRKQRLEGWGWESSGVDMDGIKRRVWSEVKRAGDVDWALDRGALTKNRSRCVHFREGVRSYICGCGNTGSCDAGQTGGTDRWDRPAVHIWRKESRGKPNEIEWS